MTANPIAVRLNESFMLEYTGGLTKGPRLPRVDCTVDLTHDTKDIMEDEYSLIRVQGIGDVIAAEIRK